jgi:hypothetical protein
MQSGGGHMYVHAKSAFTTDIPASNPKPLTTYQPPQIPQYPKRPNYQFYHNKWSSNPFSQLSQHHQAN